MILTHFVMTKIVHKHSCIVTGLLNPAPSQPASSAAPNVGGFGDFSTANIASGTTSSTGGGSDKYAALADLDNVFGTAGGSSQAVNWDGGSNNTGGGNLSWNSTGTSINSSGGGNGGNWNSSATPSMSSATNASGMSAFSCACVRMCTPYIFNHCFFGIGIY